MLNVIAYVKFKPGTLAQVIEAYRRLLPEIFAREPGCLGYEPGRQAWLGLPNEIGALDTIVVSERWRSAEDFRAHLLMPHTLEFRERIAPCLEEGITVQVCESLL